MSPLRWGLVFPSTITIKFTSVILATQDLISETVSQSDDMKPENGPRRNIWTFQKRGVRLPSEGPSMPSRQIGETSNLDLVLAFIRPRKGTSMAQALCDGSRSGTGAVKWARKVRASRRKGRWERCMCMASLTRVANRPWTIVWILIICCSMSLRCCKPMLQILRKTAAFTLLISRGTG